MGKDEFEFVREAFATNWIAPLGPHVDAFEKEFAAMVGSAHAAALSSGTAALHLALKLVGLQAGEEVFVSSLTFSASVNPIVYEGGKPVFIDSDRASWNMDPALLEKAFVDRKKKGRLPRAVVLVHLYGQSADINPIAALCERYGVPLIEDAAEALGAVYYRSSELSGAPGGRAQLSGIGSRVSVKGATVSEGNKGAKVGGHKSVQKGAGKDSSASVRISPDNREPITDNNTPKKPGVAPGSVGRLGVFSFNGNKIITTSGGGMLVSNDEALIKKARFLATQARDPAAHYQHSEIGYNYRLSNVLAGIGRGQLRVLEERVNARRANCAFYQKAFADLPGIEFMPEPAWSRSTRWLTCVLIDPKKFGADREQLRLAFEAENIEARPVWKPMHLQPIFAGCDCFGGAVAENFFHRGLCLPSGSNLVKGDLERVEAVVRRVAVG